MPTSPRTVHVCTALMMLALGLVCVAFVRLEAAQAMRTATYAEDVARLNQWAISHDQLDNERYQAITILQNTALDNKQRLAKAEQGLSNLQARMDDLIWWVRSVFVALVLQLVGAVIKLVEAGKLRRIMK